MTLQYSVGSRIKFKSEKHAYTIRACNDHFLVCTKPFNLQHTVIYTIVDLERQIRGTETMQRFNYEADEDCQASLAGLAVGESSVSRRNWVELDIEAVSAPKPKPVSP